MQLFFLVIRKIVNAIKFMYVAKQCEYLLCIRHVLVYIVKVCSVEPVTLQ